MSAWDLKAAAPPPVKTQAGSGRYGRCYDEGFGPRLRALREAREASAERETVIVK